MKQNQMFSERDTLEEAHSYATDIALSLDKGDVPTVLTAINVLTNTAIKLLEEKEAARKVKVSFQIRPIPESLPPGTYHAKLVGEAEPLDSRLRENFNIEGTTTGRFFSASEKAKVAYAPASSTPTSEAVALRSQIDAATRQVTDLHDLRFILFALDYILARKPS